jgi:hypothetical protein
MKNKLILFFFLMFALSYFLTHAFFQTLSKRHYSYYDQQALQVNDLLKDRFERFLNTINIVGLMAAQELSNGQTKGRVNEALLKKDYEKLGHLVTNAFNEIIGLNLLDENGKIVKVYPYEENKDAISKKTQNFKSIKDSVNQNEPFWFSPPFSLYQGVNGFAFYVPVYRDDSPLNAGWIATVISSDRMFVKIRERDFFKKYHLVIADSQSGKLYFTTGRLPDLKNIDYHRKFRNYGRNIDFYIWPKNGFYHLRFPWYVSFILSLLFATLLTITLYLYHQRRDTRRILDEIKVLIKFTAKEASLTLTSFYKELNLMGKGTGYVPAFKVSKYVSYISTLLDQISITEKFIGPDEIPDFEFNQVQPLLTEQLELFEERLIDKKIIVKIDETASLTNFEVWSNNWLFCHSVLGNILRVIYFYAKVGTELKITFFKENKNNVISFHVMKEEEDFDKLEEAVIKRCLYMAQEVAKLSNGEIQILESQPKSMTIVLTFAQNTKKLANLMAKPNSGKT